MLRAGSRGIWASPEAARREASTASAKICSNRIKGPLRSLRTLQRSASVEESSTTWASGRRFKSAIKGGSLREISSWRAEKKIKLNLVLERRGRTPRGGAWGSDSTLRFCRNRRGRYQGGVPVLNWLGEASSCRAKLYQWSSFSRQS